MPHGKIVNMNRSYIRNIPGLLIVLLGLGFLLDAINLIEFGQFAADWWPSLLIVVGLLSLASNPSTPFWPLAIVAIGALLQLNTLDILDFDTWNIIWPTVLIVVGLSLIPSKRDRKKELSDDSVDASAIFSGIELTNNSKSFSGGRASAVFGGTSVDLSDAKIKDRATLEIFVAFGGIELRVPEGWRIVVDSMPVFGGIENKTTIPSKDKAPVLRIKGTCLFGGVEIKN